MKTVGESLQFSARDLSGHVQCQHLTQLELGVARGALKRPKPWSPSLEALWERGFRHERDFVQFLADKGFAAVTIAGIEVDDLAVESTLNAMRGGADVIVQAALRTGEWVGRADVLRKVERPSALGAWSYEAYDTKLSRETKAGTILQLSLYSELLAEMQGASPEHMHVVVPWAEFVPQTYRVADYAAYQRRVRSGFVRTAAAVPGPVTYPHPAEHCDICSWRAECEARRRSDDHLSLVAGITSLQIAELEANGIATLEGLAGMPLPMRWKPQRGTRQGFERVREQARLQLESRLASETLYETLPVVPRFGLAALPEPGPGDIYLDFEGDSFVGEHGQEYLLGYHFADARGVLQYVALWGLTRADEKAAFETFIDFVLQRWEEHPGLHIYHYGAYEAGALKRLMGRYATREDELDRILRGRLMVDLLTVVRHSIRAGVESYSIKKLEPLYGYVRQTDLPDANLALTRLQTALELDDLADIGNEDRETVAAYNRDDCVSTRHLHLWLEQLRASAVEAGEQIDRPVPGDESPTEKVAEWIARIAPLVAALTDDVPADPADRTAGQHARWLLGNMLDFHRREDKASWWELFRLRDLDAEDLLEEKAGLGGLQFVEAVGGTSKCPVHRYSFPPQETDLRPGKKLKCVGGESAGSVEAIDPEAGTVDIKKAESCAGHHPAAVFTHEHVGSKPMQEALVRLAEYVTANGLDGEGQHQAARDLLLRVPPRCASGGSVRLVDEDPLSAAMRIAGVLEAGILPVQGPPGAGKTYTGSRMIAELVRRGRRVGVVSNSHAVVRNLLDAVIARADEQGLDLQCIQKPRGKEPGGHRLRIAAKDEDVFAALSKDSQVGGGTAWLWSSPQAFEAVDVLFVDEAAQMSLANVLAVSQAARAVVLLGDPRQLDQPLQGSHPEGTDASALDHLLGGAATIRKEQGLFLEETWRLHPEICAFTSELFYEGKLRSRPGLEVQAVGGDPSYGSGLRYVPVQHFGNSNCSPEEAEAVAALVRRLVEGGARWTDKDGSEHPVGLQDILVITPYNAQVFEIQQRIPGARVGTVDKFQGQEAAVAIYSLATSSQKDAPRGMEFLYSLNRLNVATSRARCLSFLVCSPAVFEAGCRSPRQVRLANAFCRFIEMTV